MGVRIRAGVGIGLGLGSGLGSGWTCSTAIGRWAKGGVCRVGVYILLTGVEVGVEVRARMGLGLELGFGLKLRLGMGVVELGLGLRFVLGQFLSLSLNDKLTVILVLGLAHRNDGRVTRTNAFDVMFRVKY